MPFTKRTEPAVGLIGCDWLWPEKRDRGVEVAPVRGVPVPRDGAEARVTGECSTEASPCACRGAKRDGSVDFRWGTA
jgi:hypothetical protein